MPTEPIVQRSGKAAQNRALSNGGNETIIAVTPDAELVGRAKEGDLDAFEALADRYEQRVYSLALRRLWA